VKWTELKRSNAASFGHVSAAGAKGGCRPAATDRPARFPGTAAYEKSRYIIAVQSYDVVNALGSGNCVVLETTAMMSLGNLTPGETVRAGFAQFFGDGL
jgi:hypothetical protein